VTVSLNDRELWKLWMNMIILNMREDFVIRCRVWNNKAWVEWKVVATWIVYQDTFYFNEKEHYMPSV
jgi:hypothetical protein